MLSRNVCKKSGDSTPEISEYYKQVDIPGAIKVNISCCRSFIIQPEITMKYSFKSEYQLNVSPEIVWSILSDVEAWPGIWKYFKNVQLRGNDKTLRQNIIIDCEVRSILPYTFRFNTEIVKVIPYKELEVISRGDLSGRGYWQLVNKGSNTLSSFTWEVEPENKFIRIIGSIPFGSSLLRYSHNIMMDNGYRSLLAFLENNKISKPF